MGTETNHALFALYEISPEGTSPGMGTETVLRAPSHTTSESGRDIPRYGDGNNFKLIIETLLSGRDIPRYGDGNISILGSGPFESVRDIPRYGDGN